MPKSKRTLLLVGVSNHKSFSPTNWDVPSFGWACQIPRSICLCLWYAARLQARRCCDSPFLTQKCESRLRRVLEQLAGWVQYSRMTSECMQRRQQVWKQQRAYAWTNNNGDDKFENNNERDALSLSLSVRWDSLSLKTLDSLSLSLPRLSLSLSRPSFSLDSLSLSLYLSLDSNSCINSLSTLSRL